MKHNESTLKFYKARLKHIDFIYNLESETLPLDVYSKDAIKENLKNKSMINIIAKVNDSELIGYGCLSYFDNEGELLKLSIKKLYQKNGYGRLLLAKIIHESKLKGIDKIFLEVRESNLNAISFYKKFGFNLLNTRKEYYSDGTNALIMEYDIL